ncbi:PREDICTED: putative nuclease HARBI1 [Nanorana parkeri]|uniref:putative nuclease HARBI1 n=1 Tax=Nanorana parkeri TaxID=125878 RepID=UPI0008540D90|nr:PREDICTED: putative nuclease HARBI1 [Nanorana parkeri]
MLRSRDQDAMLLVLAAGVAAAVQTRRAMQPPADGEGQEQVVPVRIRQPRMFRRRAYLLDGLSDNEVVRRYRLSRPAIQELLNLVGEDLEPQTKRNKALPGVSKLLAVLHFLGSATFQPVTSLLNGMSQPTFSRILRQVVEAIMKHSRKFVKFPESTAEWQQVKHDFFLLGGMPDCLGAIDCTHVALAPPREGEEMFRNRKNFHSLNVQVVCDSHLRIMSVNSAFPGSCNDSYILRQSALFDKFHQGQMPEGWLMGDAGYGTQTWLMTPLKATKTVAEKRYNCAHRKTRNCIKRLFGVWKSRFRCLSSTGGKLLYAPTRVADLVIVCAVLHNLACKHGVLQDIDEELPPEIEGLPAADGDSSDAGRRRRAQLIASHFA